MIQRSSTRGAFLLGGGLLLSACASTGPSSSPVARGPSTPAEGSARSADPLAGHFAAITPGEAARAERSGQAVRWGGGIDRVELTEGRTCFVMRSAGLDTHGRPAWTNEASGERFVACHDGVYDTDLLAPFRELTFVGRIDGQHTLGGEAVAKIQASVVYLWSDCVSEEISPQCVEGLIEPSSWLAD